MSRRRIDQTSARRALRGESGFTLVEALVALGVFAMAGVALVQLQTHSLTMLSRVEQGALGQIVAQNALVEVLANARAPDLGESKGEVELGGRKWSWLERVEATSAPETQRVSVIVADASGRQLAVAQAFVTAPSAQVPAPPPTESGGAAQ